LAAEVLANELRLDLYHIDLSRVVSKYIGQTEDNLRRVFDAAEENGAILLFDEADSLFGSRSEVQDSHDRYANIEVSYLLQRMEAYRGLAILTTNMRGALDSAFLRRIRFAVEFPFPARRADGRAGHGAVGAAADGWRQHTHHRTERRLPGRRCRPARADAACARSRDGGIRQAGTPAEPGGGGGMGLAARLAEASVAVAQRCAPMLQRACYCGAPAAFSGRCEACDRLSLGPRPASAHPPLPLRPARPPKPERGPARAAAPIFLPAPAIRSTAPVAPQTRLHLSSPGDAAEREAHAVGRQVARMPEPGQPMPVQQHDTGGRTVFQRAAGTAEMHEDALARIEAGGSSGEALPTRLRLFMEPRFGTDFGAVRIHKDGHAAALGGQLGAQAFTVGRDIYFGKDQFQPDSPAGRELIAHELTHTIQQGHVAQKPAGPVAKPVPAGKAA
jgi:hypothetical protein